MGKHFRKLSFVIVIGIYHSFALAKVEAVIGSLPVDQNPNLIGSIPDTKESEIIISKDQYVISYNKYKRIPNWVSWKLEPQNFGNSGRTNNFQQDTDLENYLTKTNQKLHAVTPDEYKGSCFDRGHQIPSADRTTSVEDNSETFQMSNMIPQTAYLNRIIWENLESYTRTLVKNQNKKVYIIAGPIYDEDFGNIGPNKDIKVPSKEFKIIYIFDVKEEAIDTKNAQIISVIMPNTLKDGSKPDFSNGCKNIEEINTAKSNLANNDWEKFKTSVSEIEKVSGLKLPTP